eukprot:997265-Rhodomonas_salina.1
MDTFDDFDDLVNWKDPQAQNTIAPSAAIKITGLAKAAEFNSKFGVVVPGAPAGRIGVRLEEGEKELSVKPSNLLLVQPRRVLALAGRMARQ